MNNKIVELIKKKAVEVSAKQNTPIYKNVIGKFVAYGILFHNKIGPYKGPIKLKDVLDVGEIEYRVLEVLPAVLLKRPKLINDKSNMPEDLKNILVQIKKNKVVDSFRDVPPEKYLYWIDKIGRKNIKTNMIKSFRFTTEDLEVFERIKIKNKILSDIDVIRLALKSLD